MPDREPTPIAALDPGDRRSAGRGLDWLNFFVANLQTGFGPFVSVYLTTRSWTQTSIGLALSIGTLVAMASQLPAGALVDAMPNKSRVAFWSLAAVAVSALLLAAWPIPLTVYLAEGLHGFASCTLGPAIAAMSLAIAGPATLGIRLGRNARWASIGNGIGAAMMGVCGYLLSGRAVFVLTALIAVPALAALKPLGRLTQAAPAVGIPAAPGRGRWRDIGHVLGDRRLLVFAACTMLFTLANNAMLPLAGAALTKRADDQATLLIAACIVLPQIIVAVLSPSIGRIAEARGRRPVLLVGFAMLPLRGLLLTLITDPDLVVLVQVLDGIAAACFGIMIPLVTSDIAGRSRHYTLSLGLIGFAMGIGATLSTTIAGFIADELGDAAAFAGMAGIGIGAVLLVAFAMPETRPLRANSPATRNAGAAESRNPDRAA